MMSMTTKFRGFRRGVALSMALTLGVFGMTGCVDQHPEGTETATEEAVNDGSVESMLEVTDPVEKAAVEAARAKVRSMGANPNIVASLNPDWILSPSSLQSDLQPKYENIGTDWAFLNLRSVQGMYRSIQELGEIFGREEQANKLVAEFEDFYDEYKTKNEGKEHPKVLILMGLPGSYIIATENSYVGSLVELAGGENVYAGSDQEFLTVNTEDMKTKEPDIILRTAHALPDQVVEMFKEDFETNDIWKHFDAVKNGRVYDLTYQYFGMSATFKYPQALDELQPILYPESDEDLEKARANSENAVNQAESSDATAKYNAAQENGTAGGTAADAESGDNASGGNSEEQED